MYRLHNITHFFSNRCLFEKVSLTFEKGNRIGLIGPNGSGKTTLLNVMAGQLDPDEGLCEWPAATKIGYLQQETLDMPARLTVRELALQAFEEANRLENEIRSVTNDLAGIGDHQTGEYARLVDRLENMRHRFDIMGGPGRQARAEEALRGLGFSTEDLDEPIETFSGGWQMRVMLAKMLLESPDILLLDEPTNHLDIDSMEWLERYLPGYPGAVWIVSHDRFFLNRMVSHIAALQQRSLVLYKGNYDAYEKQYEQQKILQQQAYENQQRDRAEKERFINRFRAKATKARQVQSRIRMLEKMETVEPPEEEDASIEFRFPDPPRSGTTVMEITNLNKTYNGNGENPVAVFTHSQDVRIERGDKIALIGANGSGKSTLARIINGTEPFEGNRRPGHNVIMTFFAQHLADLLISDRTVLEEMESSARTHEARARIRGILGAFLFSGDDVYKKVRILSGGERNRLALARSLLEPANLLILDEPTNHLDMRSRKVLLRALEQYAGTVVAVSHDRYFLSGFANKVWRVGGGRLNEYPGDYSYYEWKAAQQPAGPQPAEEPQTGIGQNAGDSKEDPVSLQQNRDGGPKSKEIKRIEAELRNSSSKKTRPLRLQLEALEKEIDELEKEKATFESQLADPGFYESGDAGEALKQHAALQRRLERKWNQWAQVSTDLETLQQEMESTIAELLTGKEGSDG